MINKLIYSVNCQRTWPSTWRITTDLRQDNAQDLFCEWLVRDPQSCWQPTQSREQFSPEMSSQQWSSAWGAAGALSQGAQAEHFLWSACLDWWSTQCIGHSQLTPALDSTLVSRCWVLRAYLHLRHFLFTSYPGFWDLLLILCAEIRNCPLQKSPKSLLLWESC